MLVFFSHGVAESLLVQKFGGTTSPGATSAQPLLKLPTRCSSFQGICSASLRIPKSLSTLRTGRITQRILWREERRNLGLPMLGNKTDETVCSSLESAQR